MSEIEPFPRAVLKHHFSDTLLHGDFTTIQVGDYEPIDLLVGGTPCQSFSVAGLRGGLADDRGNLAIEFLRLADRLRPRWIVWENVPGVFSSLSHDTPDHCPPNIDLDAGNGPADGEEIVVEDSYDADESHAFSCFLAGLSELGYGWAYRTLDAQFFGLAQRRRRVFVVGYLGDWRRAAAVLFERHSLSGYPPPIREKGEGTAVSPSLRARANSSHRADSQAFIPDVGYALNAHGGAHGRQDAESETLIAPPLTHNPYGDHESREGLLTVHTLRGEGFDASEDGTGRGTPLIPVCFSSKDHGADAEVDLSPTLRAGGHDGSHPNAGVPPAIAYSIMPQNSGKDYKAREVEVAQPVMAGGPVGGNQGGDYIVHAIQAGALRENPDSGPNGVGVQEDQAYTLEARSEVQAVAFALRGREGGAMPEVGSDQVGALRSASGGSSRDYVAFDTTQVTSVANRSNPQPGDPCHPLAASAHPPAFNTRQDPIHGERAQPLGAKDNGHGLLIGSAIRRLTPRECERLQGFPDDYTLIPWRKGLAPDGPRYKVLGNSFAVPVVRWIGHRIQMVDDEFSS